MIKINSLFLVYSIQTENSRNKVNTVAVNEK